MRTPISVFLPLPFVLAACGESTPKPPETCSNIEGTLTIAGVELPKPDRDAVACTQIPNPTAGGPETLCQKTPPELNCVGKARASGSPIGVTFRGCLKTFGLSANYSDLTVTVLREKKADGTPVDPGYDIHGAPGSQVNHTPSAVIASGLTHEVPETECEAGGAFSLGGVPTETDLVVRVTHQNQDAASRQFVDTYQYNVRLANSALVDAQDRPIADPTQGCRTATSCFARDDINTIAVPTFYTLPPAAGVSTIQGSDDLFDGEGQGHIAGEVQDCTSKNTLQNAAIALSKEARKIAYFNVGFDPNEGNLADPKPNSTRNRTNADGLYAAIGVDTAQGGTPVNVVAAVMPTVCGPDAICKCADDGTGNPAWTAADGQEGQALPLGSRTVYVFPDSITVMTFDRGLYEVGP